MAKRRCLRKPPILKDSRGDIIGQCRDDPHGIRWIEWNTGRGIHHARIPWLKRAIAWVEDAKQEE